jgi:hypothetical protein
LRALGAADFLPAGHPGANAIPRLRPAPEKPLSAGLHATDTDKSKVRAKKRESTLQAPDASI